jgi:hypothetical protein
MAFRLSSAELSIPGGYVDSKLDSTLSGEPLELMGKESTARFGDLAHPVLIPGFRKCSTDQFFGDLLGN